MAAEQEVSSYAPVMNLALWQDLPREFLVLILERLPMPETACLYWRLSRERIINSEFIQACDEANPNMVALLSYTLEPLNEFSVRIFDFSKNVWLSPYRLTLGNAPNADLVSWTPMASDGGLVCFVTVENPLRIVVINPLTRVQHELPPLQNVHIFLPTLVHMKVDSKTKAYKLVVIGRTTSFKIETYDSVSRQWSSAMPSWGRTWSRAILYKYANLDFPWKTSRVCAYDLEQGRLELWDHHSLFQCEGARVMQYAIAGDRVFVLHEQYNQPGVAGSKIYFITEFQSQKNATVWAPVKTYRSSVLQQERFLLDVHACGDVLVISGERLHSTSKICCFLNISTGEWQNFPFEDRQVARVCRVFWNASP